MVTTDSNAYGWENSFMREFVNTRIYNALPVQWQQIINPVEIRTTVGNGSAEIGTTYDKIYLPSYREMGASMAASSVYYQEQGATNDPIPWFISNLNRNKYRNVRRKYDNDTIYTVGTEPSLLYKRELETGDIWVNTNSSSQNPYIYFSNDILKQYGISPSIACDTTYSDGGWMGFPGCWLRSPLVNNMTQYMASYNWGGIGGLEAGRKSTEVRYFITCFSV